MWIKSHFRKVSPIGTYILVRTFGYVHLGAYILEHTDWTTPEETEGQSAAPRENYHVFIYLNLKTTGINMENQQKYEPGFQKKSDFKKGHMLEWIGSKISIFINESGRMKHTCNPSPYYGPCFQHSIKAALRRLLSNKTFSYIISLYQVLPHGLIPQSLPAHDSHHVFPP